jgi:hypothetical protein
MALGTLIQAEAESGLMDGRKAVRTDCLRAASDILGKLLEGRSIDYPWNISIEALRQFSGASGFCVG